MSVKIKPYADIKCIECGKEIRSDDKYEWVRRSRSARGGLIYIHTECYQKLLKPKRTPAENN